MMDIIIPVLNEEKILRERAAYYYLLKEKARVIFVDGGSRDKTVDVAQCYGCVVSSLPGRSIQKNYGIRESTSGRLLFLNVDSCVDIPVLDKMEQLLGNGVVCGCLTMKIEDTRMIFRFFEWLVNFRAKMFSVFDADLGLFIRRNVFESIGGFDPLPVMDDVAFSKKIRCVTSLYVLPDVVTVSSRKWQERGFLKTLWSYTRAYLHFWTRFAFLS